MKEQGASDKSSTPKRAALQQRFKAAEAVARRQTFEGSLPVAALPRLAEALSGDGGALALQIAFEAHPRAVGKVRGRITGLLPLTCQRSLEVFGWSLDIAFEWILVRSEAEEERFLADADPVMLVDEQLLLHEAIEDEVLLALPIVPLAPAGEPGDLAKGKKPGSKTKALPMGDNPGLDDSRPNPFLALKRQFPRN